MNLLPAFAEDNIPIMIAPSAEFLPYCGVCLKGIIDSSDKRHNYDIIITSQEFPPYYRERFHALTSEHSNISIRHYDISSLLSDKKFPITGSTSLSFMTHVRIEAFYRLFVPIIFRAYEKVLYLDVDLIPLEDVAHVYEIDIGDAWVAGCQDYGIMRCYVSHKLFKNYFDNELKLDPFSEYINSGVLLCNIRELNKHQIAEQWIQEALASPHLFFEQDVINKVCCGHIKFIDSQWNDTNQANTDGIPEKYIQKRLDDTRSHKIVHWCTNYRKPWVDPAHETGHIWWEVARRTPFYEEILYRNIKMITEKGLSKKIDESTKNIEDIRKALNEKIDASMKEVDAFRNLVCTLREDIEKRDSEKDAMIVGLRKQLQQLKETEREIAQLGDYRRKLRRVRWKAHFSLGTRKQKYLTRKKQLKGKIYFIERFINAK